MSMLPIILIFSLLLSSSYASDFCVADIMGRETPSGHPCKKVSNVTVEDFVFPGLRKELNFSTIKAFFFLPRVEQFPGLNGLGISTGRLHIAVGGVVSLHTHPGANVILFVVEGTMGCGFIASDNRVYYKTLKMGDAMILPQGLLQFQVNEGDTTTVAVLTFSGTNTHFQFNDEALFKSRLSTSLLQKISFLDEAEIKRLKKMFGGPDTESNVLV